MTQALLLVLAGVGAGLTGTVAGLASLVSYPALLAVGLPAVSANVTNTVALVMGTAGTVVGSQPELENRGSRVRRFAIACAIGGAIGGTLLLVTPDGAFERIVPVLIAIAAVAILFGRRMVDAAAADHGTHTRRSVVWAMGSIGVYAGYFGAGAGTMALALLLLLTHDTLPRSNAVKSVALGAANAVAAVGFVFFGDVRWSAALPLGVGLFVGNSLGPKIVRRLPPNPLRIGIAVAGLGLAVKLGVSAYT